MPTTRRPTRQARPRAGARVPRGRRVGSITFGVINFKSIASAQLEPRRLTVVAGSNSAGKSSLLQALLFLAQSFDEPTPVINGDLVRLGEARDVIRDGAEDLTLEFDYPEVTTNDRGEIEREWPRSLRLTLGERGDGHSLVPASLSLWRDGSLIVDATRTKPPTDLPVADEETVLQIRKPTAFDLPKDSFITVAGITPARLTYRSNPDEIEANFDRLIEGAVSGGQLYFLDELFRVVRSVASDEAQTSRAYDLQETYHRNMATGTQPSFSPEDRALLLEAFREVEAPNGWVSEPIVSSPAGRRLWRSMLERDKAAAPSS